MLIYNPTKATTTIVSTLVYQDGTAPVGNTIANQSGSDVAFTSSYTIPANSLAVGSVIRINLRGIYGTNIIAPNITGKIKIGAVVFLTTGTITSIAGVSNSGWTGFAEMIVTGIGTTGAIEAQGYLEFATAATTSLSVNLSNTAAISLDTTISNAITVTVQWSASNAANTISLRIMTVDILHI